MEDLRVKLNNTGMSVDDNTLYAVLASALPAVVYELEIRDLNLKKSHHRKKIIDLVHSEHEIIASTFSKSKGASNSLAFVGKEGSG